ncbi:MAG: ABC transporter permease [Solirubrobacterales bacterium]
MQIFKMAIKSITANKIRSFLTMLGVIIGVSSVIIAVGFAKGSTKNITDSLSTLGTNLININITGRGSNINLSYSQLQQFQQENSDIISSVAPQASLSGKVKAGDKNRSTTILGTTSDYADINSVTVQSGRFLLSFDTDYNQKVAVVGTAVVNDIYGGSNPVGQTIKVLGQEFKVVGVLTETQNGTASTTDDRVIIPISAATKLNKDATIRSFSVKAVSADTVNTAVDKLDTFLYKMYKNEDLYRVTNMANVLSTLSSITGTMTAVLAGIAAISLIVGGIGIMNIMLVSVTERTREIGIRKAIGAKKGNILTQFLIEALVITGIGGITGIIMACGVIHFIIGGFNIVPEVYSIPWMLLAFGISLIIGIVFGMYPANKAANLNPIDALMYE